MNTRKQMQIEINAEQPEWRVVQKLVQLGFQKECWNDEIQSDHVEVYIGLNCFSNYSINMEKDNLVTLSDFVNVVCEERIMNKTLEEALDEVVADIKAKQKQNARRLAKIHKLKQENRMFGQQRSATFNRLIALKINDKLGTVKMVNLTDKLLNLSERIGKNSAKIQRLRTLISQNK